MPRKKLTAAQRLQVLELYGAGRSAQGIANSVGCSKPTVDRVIAAADKDMEPGGNVTRRRLRFMLEYEEDFDRLLRLMSIQARYEPPVAPAPTGPVKVDIQKL